LSRKETGSKGQLLLLLRACCSATDLVLDGDLSRRLGIDELAVTVEQQVGLGSLDEQQETKTAR
jgi:hypothetical protein